MKRIALTLAALIVAASNQAQGVVNFSTRSGTMVNAPVLFLGDNTLADGRFLGQLYAAAPNERLAPVGVPTPFRSDAGKGYITAGGNVVIPGVLPGGTARIMMVAWASENGATWDEAAGSPGAKVGLSKEFTITVGGGVLPPAPLIGLEAFNIAPYIPEPTPWALGPLGWCVLLLLRKRGL